MRERLPVTLPTSCCRSGPGRLEQHRARIAFQRLRHVGEVGRAAADLELVGGKLLDEPAQPEAVEVAGRRGADRVALVDDVHEWLLLAARTIAQTAGPATRQLAR